MHSVTLSRFVPLLLVCLAQLAWCRQTSFASSSSLTVNAVASYKNRTVFECWRFQAPFEAYGDSLGAKALTLPTAGEATYSVVPPHSNGVVENTKKPG